jgi:hypothetical protein
MAADDIGRHCGRSEEGNCCGAPLGRLAMTMDCDGPRNQRRVFFAARVFFCTRVRA